jgi:hypothetical protein
LWDSLPEGNFSSSFLGLLSSKEDQSAVFVGHVNGNMMMLNNLISMVFQKKTEKPSLKFWVFHSGVGSKTSFLLVIAGFFEFQSPVVGLQWLQLQLLAASLLMMFRYDAFTRQNSNIWREMERIWVRNFEVYLLQDDYVVLVVAQGHGQEGKTLALWHQGLAS